jgi:lipoprotein-anchoring transpeptidase ErfK/SrfK
LRNSVTKWLVGAAPAAGFALALGSAAPAQAQFFFDIFNPPPQPQYSAPERPRVYEPRRSHRRYHHEVRRKRSKREAGPHTWNPKDVKGPFQVVIATGPQQALLYGQNGLIATASISTGRPDKPTPKGVFTVISKSRWHESNIYSGAPMPWMQRITWSGVAMHEGPRPGYPASHGCIRLPEDFAVRLYHTTKIGARVVVTREPVAPVPIVSDKLFVPKEPETKSTADAAPATVIVAYAGNHAMSLAARSSGAKASDVTSSVADEPAAKDTAAPAAASDAKASGETTADSAAATDQPADAKPGDTTPSADAAPAGALSPVMTGTIPLPPTLPAMLAKTRNPPVSVFVSLKQKKVFVRQGFNELFDTPATIADPDRPIGTHVYTAMGLTEDGKAMRWTAMSIPSGYRHHSRRRHKKDDADEGAPSSAAEALARLTLPAEAVKRIDELLVPGSSLIVSDNALSDEVDDSTGFIVLTP